MRHFVAHSYNGIPVYVDLIKSEAMNNIARQPHLLTLAKEAAARSMLKGSYAKLECNMSRTVGYNFIIKTDDDDMVFYARLVREEAYTRFTRKGSPVASKYLTMILSRDDDGLSYSLHDIWIGRYRPPFPGDTKETPSSIEFWKNHAVIFQNQPIQSNTITKNRPY